MLFLFNDRVFEIDQPIEVIRSDTFPLSQAAFSSLSEQDVLSLVREEIFADPLLVHDVPARAMQIATIVAAKTNANAMLAGPRAGGARTASEIAVMLAEVSLMTLSNLHIRQVDDTLTAEDVETAVWSAMR
jgi:hypothetical protein